MSLNALLHTASSAAESLAPALANHLWQSTVFAAVAGLLTLALRRNQARIRYSLWLAASLKFLIPFSLLVALGSHLQRPHAPTPQAAAVYVAMEQVSQPFPDQLTSVSVNPTPETPTLTPIEALKLALAALWLTGSIIFLLRWVLRWRQMSLVMRQAIPTSQGREFELLRQLAETLAINTRIALFLSPSPLGPGVYGIARPKLIWPSGISLRLDDAHLRTVMAHELCHVRRRDNLTAALHMLVETIFWFHPMVWWLGARLIDERERACDESVMELTNQPHIYAESILKICEFYVEPPLACVSGVTGADLKKRITQIITGNTVLKLTLGKKLLLAGTALLVVAAPAVFGQAKAAQRVMMAAVNSAPTAFRVATNAMIAEQTPSTGRGAEADPNPPPVTANAQAGPSFEVATIKPSNPKDPTDGFHANGRHIFYENQRAISLIAFAYGLRSSQVVNLPEWAGKDRYDVQGVVDQEIEPNLKQQQAMLKKLLTERFQLRLHHESKKLPVYEVTVAKGGPTLKASTGDPNGMHDENADVRKTTILLRFKNASLSDFALDLGSYVDRPVVDRTGVPGRFDFRLRYTYDEAHTVDPDAPPGLFTAVQEQMGLKLEAVTAMADVVVVDSIERPSMDGSYASAPTSTGPLLNIAEPAQADPITKDTAPVSAASPTPPFVFEVSTIKPNNSGDSGSHSGMKDGRFTATNVLLKNLMQYSAYGIPEPRILGGPKWIDSQRFDIEAKLDTASADRLKTIPRDQRRTPVQAMFQQLLVDRFHLIVHWETRDLPVYNLVVANKNGPTLAAPKNPDQGLGTSAGTGQLQAVGATLPEIAQVLTQEAQRELGRVVIDKTGIEGRYDIRLKWSPDTDPSVPSPSGPSIFTAIQEQLGLKLEPAHGPVQVLVIDHIEMPSEN